MLNLFRDSLPMTTRLFFTETGARQNHVFILILDGSMMSELWRLGALLLVWTHIPECLAFHFIPSACRSHLASFIPDISRFLLLSIHVSRQFPVNIPRNSSRTIIHGPKV